MKAALVHLCTALALCLCVFEASPAPLSAESPKRGAAPAAVQVSKSKAAAPKNVVENVDQLMLRLWRYYSQVQGTPLSNDAVDAASIWKVMDAAELASFLAAAFSPDEGAFVGENGVYRQFERPLAFGDPVAERGSDRSESFLIDEMQQALYSDKEVVPLSSKMGAALIHMSEDHLWYFPLSQVLEGLRVVSRFGSDAGISSRAMFLQASSVPSQGYAAASALSNPFSIFQLPLPAPCLSGAGTWTPCNKDFSVFWGADHNGFLWAANMGFAPVRDALTTLGYSGHTIDARDPWLSTSGNEALLASLLNSQTVFFNVHGGTGGVGVMQCYSDVAGFEWAYPPQGGSIKVPTAQCCELLKATATALNFSGASTMNCSPTDPFDRVASDPGNHVFVEASAWTIPTTGPGYWDSNYCHISSSSSWTPANRCQILASQNFFGAIGNKSALFTPQCFGGLCTNISAVADLFTLSNQINYSNLIVCDSTRLQGDVRGQAMYCKDPSNSTWQENAATSAVTGTCSGANDTFFPGAPSTLRNIQTSVSTRGAFFTGGEYGGQGGYTCNQAFGGSGLTKYEHAQIGGVSSTNIEFAPTVQTAALSPGGSLSLVFTSPIWPLDITTGFQITTSSGVKLKDSTQNFFGSPTAQQGGYQATIAFNQNIQFMSRAEWEDEPQKLTDAYGSDQNNWPWRVNVKFKGRAPNSIKMIGNQGATKKWIWGSKAEPNMLAPYLYSLGAVGAGGDTFELWLPVKPSRACCMPNVSFEPEICPDQMGPPAPPTAKQNGCNCANDIAKDQCFVGACLSGSTQTIQPGLKPAQCSGTYTRFDGTWKLWNDCCGGSSPPPLSAPACETQISQHFPPPVDCPALGQFLSEQVKQQYRERPWDQGSIGQCAAISFYQSCGEPICDDRDPSLRR